MLQEVYGISRYEKSKYNGVLFLMREAHKGKENMSLSDIEQGNKEWLCRVIHYHDDHNTHLNDDDIPSLISRYGNRFAEILKVLPIEDKSLENIAYVNINPYGGGSSASQKYSADLRSSEKFETRMAEIFSRIPMEDTKFIITCKDVFDKLLSIDEIQKDKEGLKYKNGLVGRVGKKANEHIIYLEMKEHPCRSHAFDTGCMINLDWAINS